jgi:hypothetical protein
MSLCGESLTINASGDWAATTVARDENGTALDLTGFTASIVDVTGELIGALAVTIPTPASGLVRLAVTWQGAWATGQRHLGTARILLVNGADESTSFSFGVAVSGIGLRLVVPRGADQAYAFTWPDDRDGASLAGETVDVVNASAALAGLVSVVVTDAASRACEVRIEGDLSVALGDAGTFQLRRRIAGAQPRTMPPIAVSFQ